MVKALGKHVIPAYLGLMRSLLVLFGLGSSAFCDVLVIIMLHSDRKPPESLLDAPRDIALLQLGQIALDPC